VDLPERHRLSSLKIVHHRLAIILFGVSFRREEGQKKTTLACIFGTDLSNFGLRAVLP
jgi:hypothetical protein